MNRSLRYAVLALALFCIFGCCTPTDHALSAEDHAALTAMFDDGMANLKSGNHQAWAAGFAGDGTLQPPNGPAVIGTEALEAWARSLPVIESISWPNVEVHGEGNFAWATSDYVTQFAGEPEDRGKQMVVFRRMDGGGWKVVAVSFNSDLPLQVPAMMPVEE